MFRRPETRVVVMPAADKPVPGLEFAWRTHAAQESWTAKVDVKASIVLGLSGALFIGLIAGTSKDGPFHEPLGWRHAAFIAAVLANGIGVIAAALAVWPKLGRSRDHKAEHEANFVYFGHLRYWEPRDLARHLEALTEDAELEVLARQLVRMGKFNWTKHVCLRWALGFTLLAVAVVGVVVFWP